MYSQYLDAKLTEKKRKEQKIEFEKAIQIGVKKSPMLKRENSVGSMSSREDLTAEEQAI